jgi:hypothetical protein
MTETNPDSANVSRPRFGRGGRLYKDARDAATIPADSDAKGIGHDLIGGAREAIEEQRRAEMMSPDPPPWADKPEPPKPAKPPPPVVGVKKPPEAPRDYREPISTALELAGIGLLIATGFLITMWLGTLIAGLCLILLGVATSRRFGG